MHAPFYITGKRIRKNFSSIVKRVENMTRSGVFLTNFEVFGKVVKHCLECLIYLLNRNKN